MPNTPDLIGSAEACRLLARDGKPIDRSTLTRWVQLGKLTPVLRLPGDKGAMLFRRSDVVDYAKKQAAA